MKRREFVELAALGVWGSWAPLRNRTPRLLRLGVQLFTLRSLMEASVPLTLERVARIGYREVEFAGYFGVRPSQLRRWLDDLGLAAPSAHVSLLGSDLEAILDTAGELGHSYVIQASLRLAQQRSLDGFHRTAASLNQAGAAARTRGLAVAYHNHDFEFRPVGGMVPYDVLLAETDPSLVWLEMDLYWIAKAGRDPLRYFAAHPDRFRLCHLKDMDRRGRITDVGRGTLDFPQILAQWQKAGLRHFFVEHDNPRDPLDSVHTSYNYLHALRL
ncbi:MAG TPA: sugar phosphate isomerase/epimerase [Gemmatimonadales bacterium]